MNELVITGLEGISRLPESFYPLLLLGFFVGLMVGLTSHGAGAIMTPALILFLHVPPLGAVSTAIVVGTATKGIGAWRHHRNDSVNLRLVQLLLVGSLPGLALALLCLYWVRQSELALANAWVNRVLGFALLSLGVCILARDTGWLRRFQAGDGHPDIPRRSVAIGALIGLLFGATSIGTGSLLVVLVSICFSLSEVQVVGTAVLYGFMVSLIAALLHTMAGMVSWSLVGALLLGSIPGVVVGSELAAVAPRRFLRICFSLGVVWAGWKLI